MITISSPIHALHAPLREASFFLGERVPCAKSPSRLDFVLAELTARGHEIRTFGTDSMNVLLKVHSVPYLTFLQTAWQQWLTVSPGNAGLQPFSSVWPVRTLRHDVEPNNFIAKLGLYSMDNGTPLVAGTWDAAKADADTAATAAVWVSRGEHSGFCAIRPPVIMPVQTLLVVITFLTMLRLQEKLCWQVGASESQLWMSTELAPVGRTS